MKKKNIFCIVGTRPEVIKMAPIILALQKEPWVKVTVVATAQHREMLDQELQLFNIQPDIDLNIMRPNQSLIKLSARLLNAFEKIFKNHPTIDLMIAQGDTTSLLIAALASFYHKIKFAHIEAGLRTYDYRNPFPEEMNRVLTSRLATWHFVPTQITKTNLLKEGITANNIFVTGNTVIDALYNVASQNTSDGLNLDPNKRLILLTAHRRENFGAPLLEICKAARTLVDLNKDIEILYPVHPNPHVSAIVFKELANHPQIKLCKPLNYRQLVAVLKQTYLVLTDSGGLQEEAPALNKPVLVLRNETERSEAIKAGVAKLVGTQHDLIVEETTKLLNSPVKYANMVKGVSPFGDGHATERIIKILRKKFHALKTA